MKAMLALVLAACLGGAPATPTPEQWAATFEQLPTYGDGMPSCTIDSGRRVFLTGDAITRDGSAPWPHSTVTVVAADNTAHVVVGGYPEQNQYQAVPETEAGVFHWLGPCTYSAGRLYTLAPVVRSDGSPVRVDLVVFTVSPGGDPRYAAAYPLPQQWNGALWLDPASGLVYWWGASPQATDGWTGRDVYVARTPLGSITRADQWSYRTAAGTWVKAPAGIPAPVMTAPRDGGVDLSFTAWRDTGGWHLVSRYGGPWGTLNGVPTISEWTSATMASWSRVDAMTVDLRAYLFQVHRGLGVATYSVAGEPSPWVAWSLPTGRTGR
jgi:hypothetical protein